MAPAVFPCSWILCGIVRNVTILITDTQNSSISIHLYSCWAATVHIHKLNRPGSRHLLATVAMCNIVELHLSLALQTRMTNPSRSTLKALGQASGAAWRPPVTLSWMFPHYFIMYSRLCFHGARPGLVMGGSSELFQCIRARHNLHFILLTKNSQPSFW